MAECIDTTFLFFSFPFFSFFFLSFSLIFFYPPPSEYSRSRADIEMCDKPPTASFLINLPLPFAAVETVQLKQPC